MTPADRAQLRLQRLAHLIEPSLRDAFLKAARALRPDDLPGLIRLLEAGDVEAAIDLLFLSPDAIAARNLMRARWSQALIETTRLLTRDLGRELRIRVQAPVVTPAIIDAVRTWEDDAFARIADELRKGLKESVAQELTRGLGPRQIALALRTNLSGGLTEYDARIIASFRKALEEGRFRDALGRQLRDGRFDRTLTRLANGGRLSPQQVDKMVAAYRRRLVAWRAETFARTNALAAANASAEVSWREAVASGEVDIAHLRRYWVVAQDERLCPICSVIPSQYPQGVGMDEDFVVDNEATPHPPAHPNCRCTVWIRWERPGIRQRPQPGTTRFVFPQAA